MNIMVFDVPAEIGGALAILNEFYGEAKSSQDKNIHWFFVVSRPELQETKNIKVLRFPWVKKSWLHRLYFDHFIAAKLIKKYRIDKVLSLQNIIVPHTRVPQTVYVHQSIPFVNYKFSIKEDKLLWVYQNIIGRSIIKSIKKAEKVIVQTNWMKAACIEKSNVESEKIEVLPPRINVEVKKYFEPNEESLSTFFYPAAGSLYKNHEIIVEACKKLVSKSIKDFKVIFTLMGNENPYILSLYNEVKKNNLPIEFVGRLSRDQVFELYTKSILLFPSYIETVGLPLLEAKLHRGIIVASDCLFSREILDGYENAYFFNPFDEDDLSKLIARFITSEFKLTL